jgi:chromate reductase, NAD(P)H dehydrogenase (quinone)
MMSERRDLRVLIFTGSSRKESLNDRLATLAENVVSRFGGIVDRARLSDFEVPRYDYDVELDSGVPADVQAFADRLQASDAFLFASPEYNASIPGGVKDLIDWAARMRPQPFNGSQALLLSASPSMVGGNRGLWSLRIPLEHLGTRVYPDMFSLAQAHKAFADGRIADATLQQRFEKTIECFMDLVEAATHYRGLKKQWVEFLGERPDAAIDRVETATVDTA